MRNLFRAFPISIFFLFIGIKTFAFPFAQKQYYEIRIYHMSSQQQVGLMDKYLQNSLLPALHRAGMEKVGIFHQIGNDTATDKRIFVFIPMKSILTAEQLQEQLEKDKTYGETRKDYWNAAYDNPVFTRMETILLRAFDDMPQMQSPDLKSPKEERVYELRSYESANERLNENKVTMFNKGGEIKLFKTLGFNAVFYAEVIAGCKMPNLMYMTTFENKASRDEHWKQFGSDPYWKKLSEMAEYQHNVSKADIFFLTPTDYSDF